MNAPRIASLVGNPRPQSRTHGLARTLAEQIARVLGATGVADAGGLDGPAGTACAGTAVTVTIACGAAEPLWVLHALVSRAMPARTTGMAVRRGRIGMPPR